MTPRFSELEEWLQWQETLHPSTIDLGLTRIHAVAVVLWGEHFQAQQPLTITVGGTNGKGSCVTVLAAMLRRLGKRVGSFTSPHLFRYNERIRIDDEEVSDQDLCAAFAAIDQARGNISLTYFEFNALAALWVFKKYAVDVQVLEVGLGGRLDAANLLNADIAVITNIALDHVDWLGDTREKIGAEKAGILRANGKLVYGESDMPASIQTVCDQLAVDILQIENDFSFSVIDEHFVWRGLDCRKNKLFLKSAMPVLPLPSVACALQVLAWLGLWDEKMLSEILPVISLAGRMEKVIQDKYLWILDVAHNEAGAVYLSQRLQQEGISDVALVFSAMADKDVVGVLSALEPLVSRCILFSLQDNPRAATLEQLTQSALKAGIAKENIVACNSASEAVNYAQSIEQAKSHHKTILACGSFFTVAVIAEVLR